MSRVGGSRALAIAALAGTTLSWAGIYIVGDGVVERIDPISLTFLRWGPAAILLLVSGCGTRNPYPLFGDVAPHDGVAAAHQMAIQGIDISRYQGNVDWNALQRAGTQFVFIKATEGGDYIDPQFRTYWNAAADAGIPRGAYHFVYWCRPAHEQMLWFMLNVPNDPGALPPVLDVEWNNSSASCPHQVTPEVARQMVAEMLVALEAHTGKRPIIYTDINFYRDVLYGSGFDAYPFWVRSVAADPFERYFGQPWTFWQFTATGRVPGIDGNVDRNAFAGSERDWNRWLGQLGVR